MSDLSPRLPLIAIENLSKSFAASDGTTVRAIASVSCSIDEGEFVSILGPSGCGKSTLLMMLAGLLRPSTGTITLNDALITGPQEHVGFVFQSPVLFPWRTVQANIELPGEIRGVAKRIRAERAHELIQLVGLAGFESKYPNELSGGMQQRVAIARALSLNPSLLLMDEPFGALDAMTREQMNLELQRISLMSKVTVVLVTHSISESVFLSDRVFVMSGRPSTLRAVVNIDVPRPRDIDSIASDRFGRYIAGLRGMLEGGAR
ncbi:MAG: ABC transporter ATP-binding protein [Alphaproteobacteria bacterium]